MELQKVILYYGFAPVADPEAVRLWQKNLCETLGIKGRILISKHGINGTLGGEMEALKKYVRQTKEYPGFKKIDFKWSDGTGNDFPRLRVRVRDELVAFGSPDEIKVDINGVVNGGKHLKPYEVDKLVAERGQDVVFFDGRNAYEAKIGKFKDAVVPDVVTYCTGGIRCEILSAVMVNRGFKEVYQIEGGIVRYGNKFADSSHWEGSLYTFDNRMTIDFSDETKVIGQCDVCQAPTKNFYNCANPQCHELFLLCDGCQKDEKNISCIHDVSRSHKQELIG